MLTFPNRQIIKVDETTSTKSCLADLSINTKLPEGSVVLTNTQTQGRGLGENSWESEPGKNLTFSIILYPSFVKAENQFVLSKVISLGVCDFIRNYVAGTSVKWPNDVYVADKKITGILIENYMEGAFLTKTIAGIGININQEQFFSHAPNPVSLHQLTGEYYDLNICLEETVNHIATRYQMLKEQSRLLDADYLKYMYRFGKTGKFRSEEGSFEAAITGINRFGMLELTTTDQVKKTFGFKEVSFE